MENGSLAAAGLYAEPPLSPGAGTAPVASVAPVQAAPAEPQSKTPSLERMLLKFGLMSQEQLSEAMVEERTTGRPLWEIVQERGWVTREDLVRLAGQTVQVSPPAPAPVLEAVAPTPVVEVAAPAAETAPAPTPAPAPAETGYRVLVRLSNGERIEAHACDGAAAARGHAEELVRSLVAATDRWPYFSGRFVRPDSIVSIDVEAAV